MEALKKLVARADENLPKKRPKPRFKLRFPVGEPTGKKPHEGPDLIHSDPETGNLASSSRGESLGS